MDLTRENFRSMIFYDFKCNLTAQQSIARLETAFGDEAPCKTTVYSWFAEFKRGRINLSDESRDGRPSTAVTNKNIDAVRRMIETDRHVTYHEIRASLEIGMSQIQSILHKHLGVRKLCSRWIPHNLTEDQKTDRVTWCRAMLTRFNEGASNLVWDIVTGDETWIYCYDPKTKQQSSVWVFQDEPKPTKVARVKSASKRMIASFFNKTGHVATVALENRRTVNSDWYTTICLPEVIDELRKNNRKRRIILHHDNASSHTARQTNDFLKAKNVELMSHPAYSPDLAPCDFYLFPKIKNQLRGKRFSSPDEAVEEYEKHVSEVTTEEWHKSFQNWFDRMKKCIDAKGDYFEKQ